MIPPSTSPTFVSSLRPVWVGSPRKHPLEQHPARQGPAAFTEYPDGPDGPTQEAGEPRPSFGQAPQLLGTRSLGSLSVP